MNLEGTQLYKVLDSIISFFEKERFGILTLFLWITFLSALRMWTEAKLLGYAYQELSYQFFFAQLHITAFFITVYIGGVLLLKFYSKQRLAKVANLSALGFIMVLVPPFIDLMMHQNPNPYTYGSPLFFVDYFNSLITGASGGTADSLFEGGLGIIFELVGITIATSLYVLLRSKSIIRTALSFVSFVALFIVIGSPFLVLLRSTAGQLIHPLFIVRYIAISIILLLLLLWTTNKQLFRSFIKSSRLLTTAHFSLMTLVGIFIAGHLQQIEFIQFEIGNIIGDPVFWQVFTGNIGTFFLSIFTIVFVWQFAVMINHVYDAQIDRVDNTNRLIPSGLLSRKQVKKIALVYAIIAVGLGASLGVWNLVFVLLGLFFGTIYSVPPIRLRDGVFSTTIIGIGSTIAFFLGYLTPGYIKVMHGELARTITRTYPEITTDSLAIGLVIFIALTIGPLIKDYKDYEGDKKAGVKNLFTLYGLEKGVKITSILLPVPFLCLLLLFNTIIDIAILVPFGLLAGIVFYKMKDTRFVFAIYFPVILYCLLRWFSVISF